MQIIAASLTVIILAFIPRLSAEAQPARMQGILDQHNQWRKDVGVPALKWSVKLAMTAQEWANSQAKKDCRCTHSTDKMYGENIFCSDGVANISGNVADSWASEKKYYNHETGKCKGGECGHYTQMVWRATTEVGCAMVKCGSKEFWVCNYNPPGNYLKQKAY